jgi:hypothetical protein
MLKDLKKLLKIFKKNSIHTSQINEEKLLEIKNNITFTVISHLKLAVIIHTFISDPMNFKVANYCEN